MGVNLSPIVEARPIELSDLRGKTIAVDAYNTIFQFLSIIRQADGRPLCDEQGRTTSHLSGLLYRTANLIENGIEPSFVFDGKPSELKAGTIEERIARREKAKEEYEQALAEGDMKKAFSKAQQTSRMTPEILATSKELLTLMGVPVVQAPSDGEAQGAYMCLKGDVYASASQDFDSLLFGAPLLVRNLTITGRRKMPGKNVYRTVLPEIVDSQQMLTDLGITREQLVDACIMIGTDFNPGVQGIGPKKGLKLIQKHGTLEKVIEANGYDIPGYEDVREIFLNGPKSDDYAVKQGVMDRDGVLDMMTGYGFSEDRIRIVLDKIEASRKAESDRRKQRSLDSWFRSGSDRQLRDAATLGVHAAVDVAAPLVRAEPLLGALHVAVHLPAADAPAAHALVLDVALDVLHRVVEEHPDLGRAGGAVREPLGELVHHAHGIRRVVTVAGKEGRYLRIGEALPQLLRAVDVDQAAGAVEVDYRDPDSAGHEHQAQVVELVVDTTRVGFHPEHASALQARQSRRTMTDDARLQIGYGGFRPPGVCLYDWADRLMDLCVVGKSPSAGCVGVVIRPHGN